MNFKISNETSKSLDAFRGVAALLVVLGHSRQHAAKTFNLAPEGDSIIEKFFLIPSSFAMESVAVFFVLSGFLVGGQTIRLIQRNQFSWLDFLAKRVSRLWLVLLPGILFTWIVFEISSLITDKKLNNLGVEEAICNAFFLQEALCDTFANNDSLWSLSYEFWFYCVFAGMATTSYNFYKKNHALAVLGLSVVLFSLWIFGLKLLLLIPAWLIGAAVSLSPKIHKKTESKIKRNSAKLTLSSIFLISTFSILSNFFNLHREPLTFFVSIPAALFIFFSLYLNTIHHSLKKLVELGAFFGARSFSIYVFHLPSVILFLDLLKYMEINSNIGLAPLTYATFLFSLPISLAMWIITEQHSHHAKKLALTFASYIRNFTITTTRPS